MNFSIKEMLCATSSMYRFSSSLIQRRFSLIHYFYKIRITQLFFGEQVDRSMQECRKFGIEGPIQVAVFDRINAIFKSDQDIDVAVFMEKGVHTEPKA